MFGTARGFIWRPFKGCISITQRIIFTNAIMFGACVLHFVDPTTSIGLRYLISQKAYPYVGLT